MQANNELKRTVDAAQDPLKAIRSKRQEIQYPPDHMTSWPAPHAFAVVDNRN